MDSQISEFPPRGNAVQLRRPRIVHVGKYYPPQVGGIETHLKLLCEALTPEFDVHALVANVQRRPDDSIVADVHVTRAATIATLSGAPICPSIVTRLRALKPDLIHLHTPNPTGMLSVIAAMPRSPIVTTWHSDVVRQRRMAQLIAPIENRFLARCAAVIATSPNYIESSATLSALRKSPIAIPYGIKASEYRESDSARVA